MNKANWRHAQRLLKAGEDTVALGRLLGRFRRLGELQDFCAQHRLGLRKAYILAEIAEAVDAGRLSETDVNTVGWAKAYLVIQARLTPAKTAKALAFAASHTAPETTNYVRYGSSPAITSKVFRIPKADVPTIDQALILCGAKPGARGLLRAPEALLEMAQRTIATASPARRAQAMRARSLTRKVSK